MFETIIAAGASLLGGLLGRRSSGSSNTNRQESITNQSGTSTTQQSGTSSTAYGSSTSFDVRNMTPEGFEAMFKAMGITEKIANDALKYYNRDQALSDAELAMAQIFREYRESELPKVFVAQAGAGLYNSTTGQLMANDAYARAVDLANARRLEFLKTYSQMMNDGVSMFLRAIDLNKGSVKQGSESTSGGSSTSSTSTSVTNSSSTSQTKGTTTGNSSGGSIVDFGQVGNSAGSLINGIVNAFKPKP